MLIVVSVIDAVVSVVCTIVRVVLRVGLMIELDTMIRVEEVLVREKDVEVTSVDAVVVFVRMAKVVIGCQLHRALCVMVVHGPVVTVPGLMMAAHCPTTVDIVYSPRGPELLGGHIL